MMLYRERELPTAFHSVSLFIFLPNNSMLKKLKIKVIGVINLIALIMPTFATCIHDEVKNIGKKIK